MIDENSKQQILELLSKGQNILIIASQNSGFDGIAASLALYLSLKQIGKNISIWAKEPTISDARSLYAVDKIGKEDNKKGLIIAVNNAVENIDKVTYSLEGDVLKINIHALPECRGINQEDITFQNSVSNIDLAVVLGFNSPEQLNNEITREQNIDPNMAVLSINYQEVEQKIAQIELHDTQSSSISEITTNLIKELRLPINGDIAFNLYSGIMQATKMFAPSYVKPSTFNAAQYLVQFGAGKSSLAANDQINQINVEEKFKKQTTPQTFSQSFNSPDLIIQQDSDSKNYKEFIDRKTNKSSQSKVPSSQLYSDKTETPIEEIEVDEKQKESWLKPPKIYKGSKSFDRES